MIVVHAKTQGTRKDKIFATEATEATENTENVFFTPSPFQGEGTAFKGFHTLFALWQFFIVFIFSPLAYLRETCFSKLCQTISKPNSPLLAPG